MKNDLRCAGQQIVWDKSFKAERDALEQRFFDTPLSEVQSPCSGDLSAVLTEAAEAIRAIRFPSSVVPVKE